MTATLLHRRGLWVATYRQGADLRLWATESRQHAALSLHAATGVWLGVGPAPREVAS